MADYTMDELIPLVARLVDIYTHKESTSVRYEVAQQLMEAVLYCINETEKRPESKADNAVKERPEAEAACESDDGRKEAQAEVRPEAGTECESGDGRKEAQAEAQSGTGTECESDDGRKEAQAEVRSEAGTECESDDGRKEAQAEVRSEAGTECESDDGRKKAQAEVQSGAGAVCVVSQDSKGSGKLTAAEAYEQGFRLAGLKADRARNLYSSAVMNFNAYGIRSYYDTFIKGMPEFFKYYDVRLRPQENILTLDYPTLRRRGRECGIDLILQYIEDTVLEQEFLERFPEGYVREMLISYHNDYEEMFENACSVVLRKVLGRMLSGKGFDEGEYQEEDFRIVQEMVIGLTEAELRQKIQEQLRILIDRGYGGRADLHNYLSLDIEDYACILKIAAENKCMGNVL